MRHYLLGLIAFGCVTAANADTLTGPVYPPPGGVTYSPTGSSLSGTQVRTYTNLDLTQSGQLFYGVSSLGLAMDGAIDAGYERLSYDASSSNLAAGILVYRGLTDFYTNFGPSNARTSFTLQLTDLLGNALALTTNPDISLNGGADPVLLVTGDFKASLTMQATYATNSDYQAAGTFFNNIANKTGASATGPGLTPLKSDIGTGFWYTEAAVPEPASWSMMIIGFGAVGFSLRQRRAMSFTA